MNATTPQAAIAVNRFGLGAKGDELAQANANPKAWLKQQLQPIKLSNSLYTSDYILTELAKYGEARRQAKKSKNAEAEFDKTNKERGKFLQNSYRGLSTDTFVAGLNSNNSVSWRLLDFFSNHFSVSASGPQMTAIASTLEREAIAPNLLGNFEDMLLAVTKHPAMIVYLNNERSFGPNSRIGKKGRGLNENLAREILELHTLGVDGGYQQQDVIELAKGITGWSIANPRKEDTVGFMYRSWGKEPGDRVLLGKAYKQEGMAQGEAMLKDLANHPKTANYVCSKLVKHFISDKPSPDLVNILVATWQKSGGNIKAVMNAMIDSDLAWQAQKQKFKTPREFVMSSLRAVGKKNIKPKELFFTLNTFGQQPMQAGSPAGYSDEQQDWDGANALMSKIDWVSLLARKSKANAEKVMQQTLNLKPSEHTYKSVVRAESRTQALALLLLSPEFLRR
ncbi:DUF1800 family protein [Thalassomonas sp. M1454]|uniref:DUF1800 domain-containing protein n=1 Tax=Thalassomonas sp. M1454 TaxID=2594477 RepID=UPI0011803076|nr:DUF1800 domain-containing protein [Thalassomonas sp. M1454]TRX53952.1 DUF1800 domain-containing protein [Thalassomonas sp. M1454]